MTERIKPPEDIRDKYFRQLLGQAGMNPPDPVKFQQAERILRKIFNSKKIYQEAKDLNWLIEKTLEEAKGSLAVDYDTVLYIRNLYTSAEYARADKRKESTEDPSPFKPNPEKKD